MKQQDSPLPEHGRSRTVMLKAVYEVKGDEKAGKLAVWTGRVSSPAETDPLWR